MAGLNDFLTKVFGEQDYDFILLQEFHSHIFTELNPTLDNYEILRMFDDIGNTESELAIVYRKNFLLQENKFYSFTGFSKWNSKWPGIFGLLVGKFQTPTGGLVVGTVHLSPLFYFTERKKEARFLKKCLIEFNPDDIPVVFGGDFNSGLPGEKISNNNIFAPEFTNASIGSGPTVDSGYVEPVVLVNKIAVFLAKWGLHIRLKVDHIYADTKTGADNVFYCRVLKDRVSDHSPMEVILTSVTTAR